MEPVGPKGAQNELQHPVQPLQARPSTMQMLVVVLEIVAQVPAVVVVAPAHTAVQQSLSWKQMSPGCVQ
jgi:hypothetical protein